MEAWKRTGDLDQGVMAGKMMKEQELFGLLFLFIHRESNNGRIIRAAGTSIHVLKFTGGNCYEKRKI